MRRAEIRKFDEIVAFAEVEKFIDTAVKHYSSGMYMRLAVAVAAFLSRRSCSWTEVLRRRRRDVPEEMPGKMEDVARTVARFSSSVTIMAAAERCARVGSSCRRRISETGDVGHCIGVLFQTNRSVPDLE